MQPYNASELTHDVLAVPPIQLVRRHHTTSSSRALNQLLCLQVDPFPLNIEIQKLQRRLAESEEVCDALRSELRQASCERDEHLKAVHELKSVMENGNANISDDFEQLKRKTREEKLKMQEELRLSEQAALRAKAESAKKDVQISQCRALIIELQNKSCVAHELPPETSVDAEIEINQLRVNLEEANLVIEELRHDFQQLQMDSVKREKQLIQEAELRRNVNRWQETAVSLVQAADQTSYECDLCRVNQSDAQRQVEELQAQVDAKEQELSLHRTGSQRQLEQNEALQTSLARAKTKAKSYARDLDQLQQKHTVAKTSADKALLEEQEAGRVQCEALMRSLQAARKESCDYRKEILELRPLRIDRAKSVLQRVVEKKLMKKRVRAMANILR